MRLSLFVLWSISYVCSGAESIVFLRIAPTAANLFISNPDGTGERPLTQPGSLNYSPAWSPKGDWIAFTSERAGSADLYRIHPDGTGLERLTEDPAYDDQAAFSPDGDQIVFVTTRAGGTADLWILDASTRQAHSLTSGPGGDFRPSWSPDGQWIAFSSDRDSSLPVAKGRWERLHLVDIYIVHPDGSGLKRVSEHGSFCGSPKWTADSRSVIGYCMSAEETWTYRSNGELQGETKLLKFDIATGKSSPIDASGGIKLYPSVLPSGEIAYFRRDPRAQGIVYGAGKPGPQGADLRSPSWSPDGKHLVFSRFVTERGPEPVKLWSRNPNYELSTTSFLPAYDATGEHLAVTMRTGSVTTLYVVDEGKPARPILKRPDLILAPQWAPDGRQMVFGVGQFSSFLDFAVGAKKPVDPVNGGAQVGALNADGSGFHVITSGPNNNAFPSFAPDGKHIVYRTVGPDGEGLRIMNLQDHSVSVLTKDYDNFPVWSPRGDLIAFVRQIGGNFEVFTTRPDGKDVRQLTNVPGNEAHLAWSPDGERILFCSTRMGFKDEALYTGSPQPYGEIFVMRKDGADVQQLTDDQWEEGGPAWQPRKKSLSAAQEPAQ